MKRKVATRVYYDFGLFEDFEDVEFFLNNPLAFLISKENDIHITANEDGDKFISCSPAWYEFVRAETLQHYCSRAKEIYLTGFKYPDDKEVAREYYEEHLGALSIGDLNSLMRREENYALFLTLYLLMLKNNVVLKGKPCIRHSILST